jgi:hypothetical protein
VARSEPPTKLHDEPNRRGCAPSHERVLPSRPSRSIWPHKRGDWATDRVRLCATLELSERRVVECGRCLRGSPSQFAAPLRTRQFPLRTSQPPLSTRQFSFSCGVPSTAKKGHIGRSRTQGYFWGTSSNKRLTCQPASHRPQLQRTNRSSLQACTHHWARVARLTSQPRLARENGRERTVVGTSER